MYLSSCWLVTGIIYRITLTSLHMFTAGEDHAACGWHVLWLYLACLAQTGDAYEIIEAFDDASQAYKEGQTLVCGLLHLVAYSSRKLALSNISCKMQLVICNTPKIHHCMLRLT